MILDAQLCKVVFKNLPVYSADRKNGQRLATELLNRLAYVDTAAACLNHHLGTSKFFLRNQLLNGGAFINSRVHRYGYYHTLQLESVKRISLSASSTLAFTTA